ncbi:toxin [Bordetella bronchiseptica]|uniref:toxin n=1 Tax=Bordetella bronchiseptica TaxID=518 RepID=UPI000461E33A|nr:toxin [Bordetella bronchiseptica]KDD45657.1 toxin subunit PtxB-PtxC-like protein [Bordetella bronchiseptica MBORD901]
MKRISPRAGWLAASLLCLLLPDARAWAASELILVRGYGNCPSGYAPLTYDQAHRPSLRARMRELSGNEPWPIHGLADGQYLGGKYGGELKRARLADIRGLRDHFCLASGSDGAIGRGVHAWGHVPGWGAWQWRPTLPPATGLGHYSNVRVARLDDLPFGDLCAVFTRDGNPVVQACISPQAGRLHRESYATLRRALETLRRQGLPLRVYVDHDRRPDFTAVPDMPAYSITGLATCNRGGCM